jgi:transcriptional regulator with XRE-family HTH domain
MNNSNIYPNLGKNIKALRKAFGKSQFEMAIDLDMSHTTISQYENNIQTPERDKLILIAKYFKITENELLYGDFTNLPKINLDKLNDKEIKKQYFDSMFPIIISDNALSNLNFQKAYNKQIKIHDLILDSKELSDSDIKEIEKEIEEFIELYELAYKDGIIESKANILWWIMLEGLFYSLATPYSSEMIDVYNNLSISELFEIICFNKPDLENEYKEKNEIYEKERIEYIQEREKDFFKNIAILKKSKRYSDLADYYIAFRYMCGLYDNSMSFELNRAIGYEISNTFRRLGNKYLRKIFVLIDNI